MKHLLFTALFLIPTLLQAQHVHHRSVIKVYVVVADTGLDYNQLRAEMFRLNEQLKLSIDTMGRTFNEDTRLVSLPLRHRDEIYAGNYLPRNEPSEFLSIEHLSMYLQKAGAYTMALVAGIYEDEKMAKKMFKKVSKKKEGTFLISADLLQECAH